MKEIPTYKQKERKCSGRASSTVIVAEHDASYECEKSQVKVNFHDCSQNGIELVLIHSALEILVKFAEYPRALCASLSQLGPHPEQNINPCENAQHQP